MTRTGVSVLTAALLLAAGTAFGDVRREQPQRRPYIVEIGEPYPISAEKLQHEIGHISGLREYIHDYGDPDYAEIQEILPGWPWEPYEVRLYYMVRNVEVAFSHVDLSEAMPNFGVLKYSGTMTPEKRHEIELVLQARATPPAPLPPVAPAAPPVAPAAQAAPPAPPAAEGGLTEALVARIEAAAERAAQAADHAAADSEAAARAAQRTVDMVDKMVEQQGAQ